MEAPEILKQVAERWSELQPLEIPPKASVILWQGKCGTIYVEDALGAAVTYPPVPRTDSESNYGYVRLKGNLAAVADIPELRMAGVR